jgi:hypothetical protein
LISGQHTICFHRSRILANAVPLGFWCGGFSSTAGLRPRQRSSTCVELLCSLRRVHFQSRWWADFAPSMPALASPTSSAVLANTPLAPSFERESCLQTPRSYAPAGSVAVTEVLALSACRRQHLTHSRGCGNRGPRFRGAYTGLGTLTPRAFSAGGAFAIVLPSLTLHATRQARRTSFSPAHRFPIQAETVHR